MGIVWEAYHKGVPFMGVPGITLDRLLDSFGFSKACSSMLDVFLVIVSGVLLPYHSHI